MQDNNERRVNIKKINHVGVPISDRRLALPFYRDILGLKLIPPMVNVNNIIWMKTEDGTMVHLIEPSDQEGAMSPGWHIALEVENFNETIDILQNDLGCRLADGPGERLDGQKYAFLTDPDGNRIEITSASNLRPTRREVDEWGRGRDVRGRSRS